jgi:hypothetical protein
MATRINAKVEKALRDAMAHAAHAEADQIEPSLAVLDQAERTEAIGLAIMVAGYVVVDACGSHWPDDASVRKIAHGLATVGTTARRLQLDADEIYLYLSRSVLGGLAPDDVITDEAVATRLAVIVAAQATAVYSPKEMDWWVYLDQIESAIEVTWALDASVIPATVMRAYLPKAKSLPRDSSLRGPCCGKSQSARLAIGCDVLDVSERRKQFRPVADR